MYKKNDAGLPDYLEDTEAGRTCSRVIFRYFVLEICPVWQADKEKKFFHNPIRTICTRYGIQSYPVFDQRMCI